MKSYTDLEQSNKLAEILPIESADMYYTNRIDTKYQGALSIEFKCGNPLISQEIPAWSLAALLDIIPKRIKNYTLRIDISNDFATVYYDEIGYGINNDLPNIITESAIDACVEMIIELHEQKLL